jgi:YYY domain-containing protein
MIPFTMRFRNSVAIPRDTRYKLAFAVILVAAALLRFAGQDWDEGHYFHPDERFIATVMDSRLELPALSDLGVLLDPDSSPLNTRSDDENGEPREFAYGSLPFLLTTILGTLINTATDTDILAYDNVGEFGRFLTTIVDLGTIAITILFCRKAFNDLAAAIAGLLATCSVVLIQLANFFTVDTWVTFFSVATLYCCLCVAQTFSLRWTLFAAALGGAALATKVSVGVLGIPILVAMAIGVQQVTSTRVDAIREFAKRLALSGIPAIVVFATSEPYALWRRGPFIDDIRNQWEIVNGHYDVPFTRQFIGTISGLNEIQNLVLWGVAPGFGIAAIIATGIGIYWAVRTRDVRYILLLSWIVPYFYVIASSEARFLRYAAPLVPPLAIMVGHQLALWWDGAGADWRQKSLPSAGIAVVTGITVIWSLAFMSVYSGEHPRVEASEWIYENIEPGATITHEIWDDRLPVRLESGSGDVYQFEGLDLYSDRSNEEAFEFVSGFLEDADYIVLASQRLSHSIPRSPWRYPVQSEYYRLLAEEKLGFELAGEFTNYPAIGGVEINTLSADESFSVYDHPPVRIYQKVEELSRSELALRFAHAVAQPRTPERQPEQSTLRLDAPISDRTGNGSVEWSSQVTGFAPAAIAVWLAAILVLVAIAMPLSVRLFSGFPDLGAGFAPLIGLLGVGGLVWIPWSFELVRFTPWLVLFACVTLGSVSWLALGQRGLWIREVRRRWPFIAGSLGVFLAAFTLFLLIRSLNPDLWHPFFGGEKPMETAFLNAIARTGEYQPYDPWFADGTINYYYYGFFLLVIVWNLTGVPFDLAFQLSLATVAGLFASGLFSLGSALARSVLHTRNTFWIGAGGVVTVVLVMLAGNLAALIDSIQSGTLSRDFWAPTRAVDFAINEFPYFSLIYADVHPHLIAAPVLVLLVALAFAWIASDANPGVRWRILWVICAAVTAGSLTLINLWDGPTALVILLAAFTFSLLRDPRSMTSRVSITILVALSTGLISYGFLARFFMSYVPQTGRIEMTSRGTSLADWGTHFGGIIAPFLLLSLIGVFALFTRRRYQFGYLAFGAGLGTATFLLGATFVPVLETGMLGFLGMGSVIALAGALIAHITSMSRRRQDLALITVSPFIALAGALALSRPVAAVSSLLVAAFLAQFWSNQNRDGAVLLAIAGATGSGLVMVADLVYIGDHLQGTDWQRMNTVFKFYFQAWTLLGIVAAASATWLAREVYLTWTRFRRGENRLEIREISRSSLIGTLLLAMVVAWLSYPVLATGDRLNQRIDSSPDRPSLSGYEWMEGGEIQNQAGEPIDFSGDRMAIEWFKSTVAGNPVILEASIGAYRGAGARISSATGLPTVLGWASHQSQQRGGGEIGIRDADIRETYQTTDLERKHYLIRKYDVEYVVVGDVERFTIVGDYEEGNEPDYYADQDGLAAFDEMEEGIVSRVFDSGNTVVYRVQPFPSASEYQ